MASVMRPLAVGDRVRIYAGYNPEPWWLTGHPHGYMGQVTAFIPGQNDTPAVVVELDEEVVLEQGAAVEDRPARGRWLVLELRHVGTVWSISGPVVHVELCDFPPPPVRWQDRRHGAWVESHAQYEVLGSDG